MSKHIAVIGAGCSGLAAVKSCLEEGLTVTCFEREDDIGGLWCYTDECKPGKGSVYKSCVINTSKEMTAYSDFPVPDEFPPFMPHNFVMRYVRMYADVFKLKKHIRFNCSVESIVPAEDYDKTGRWQVSARKTDDSQSEILTVETFDGVMVCTGHHVYPHVPRFDGIENFKGCKMHSQEYRRPEMFEGKKVLIIGVGNSAVDIAVDISRTADQVYLSTRRGAWIVARMGPLGFPADALANSRFMFTLPRSWLQWMVEVIANFRFDHENYGLKARHRALEAHPTINDDLPHRIMVGKVQVRPNVARFGRNFVEFDDGTGVEVDAVIFATGYDYSYKFLDSDILPIKDNQVDLYKFVFPPNLKHATLSLIGLVQAIGAVIPISEMQARWCTRVMKGKVKLPGKEVMDQDIQKKKQNMGSQYVTSRRHHLQTFWIEYMDEIAELIGVRPSMFKLFITDPFIALRCFLGPCIPAQYRLTGPAPWPGARNAIKESLWKNVTATKTRIVEPQNQTEKAKNFSRWVRYITILSVVFCFIFVLFWSALLTI